MDPPAVATLQGMARQRATLQARERMRILKWALASVNDSIALCDDQELQEAFNQLEAGVRRLNYLVHVAEAQQHQRRHAACAACAEARERLTRWLQTENRENVRAHRAQEHAAADLRRRRRRPSPQNVVAHKTCPPPPTPNWMPGAPLPTGAADDCIPATVPADPVVALTAAEDAAATPPPPPALQVGISWPFKVTNRPCHC